MMTRTYSISTIIRVYMMVLFLLTLFGLSGFISGPTILIPSLVLEDLQLWRLLTYPLAPAFMSVLVGAVVFGQPGEEVEGMFGRKKFGLLLLVITLAVGGLHLLLFASSDPPLAGLINQALFMMVVYVYLFPQSSVHIFFFSVRSIILLGLMLAAAIIWGVVLISGGASLLTPLVTGLLGAIAGYLYAELSYGKHREASGLARRSARSRSGSMKGVTKGGGLRVIHSMTRTKEPENAEIADDETRMNKLLDKISDRGYDALTADEKEFLERYSSRI